MVLISIRLFYWVAVSALPFVPLYLGHRVIGRMGCSFESECFRYGMTFFSEQGIFLVISGALLWPVTATKSFLIVRELWKRALGIKVERQG